MVGSFIEVTLNRYRPGITRRALLAAACLLAAAAQAEDRTLGAFKSWLAQSFTEGESTVCMMWSQPEKDEGKYTRRGEIFVFITHRPADEDFDRVSFEMGYPFKASEMAQVTIGDSAFRLRTEGSTAWAESHADDQRLVKAMRAGREMIVEGVSSRGTKTRDTYSLYGFTKAHRAIGEACRR